MPNWLPGDMDRRKGLMDLELRDKIIETHSDIKYLIKAFGEHIMSDDKRHAEISKKIEFHQKVIYGGVGILAAIELLNKILK